MNNAIRYNSEENYQADLKVMQAKFAQVIEAGVRQIAILADDAGNVGGDNYIKTLKDMTAWIKEMQKTYPDLKLTLPFCTQEYMGNGQGYYTNFPENVQIVMTLEMHVIHGIFGKLVKKQMKFGKIHLNMLIIIAQK